MKRTPGAIVNPAYAWLSSVLFLNTFDHLYFSVAEEYIFSRKTITLVKCEIHNPLWTQQWNLKFDLISSNHAKPIPAEIYHIKADIASTYALAGAL